MDGGCGPINDGSWRVSVDVSPIFGKPNPWTRLKEAPLLLVMSLPRHLSVDFRLSVFLFVYLSDCKLICISLFSGIN